MTKLRLKRTPAEEAERAWRKTQRAARKAARRADRARRRATEGDLSPSGSDADSVGSGSGSGSGRKRRRKASHTTRKSGTQTTVDDWPDSDDDVQCGPQPSSARSHGGPSYEGLRAEMENARFRAKLADALDEDSAYDPAQRLDGVESHLNSYVHVPRRWRGVGGDAFTKSEDDVDGLEEPGLEPWQMNDDEYAEWIRAAMWRKKNPDIAKERIKAKIESRARAARAKELKLESERLMSSMERERKERTARRKKRKYEEARVKYEKAWSVLLDRSGDVDGETFTFDDLPWPVFPPLHRDGSSITAESITRDAVSAFLLSPPTPAVLVPSPLDGPPPPPPPAPHLIPREMLRATLLRYHPDKFDARVLPRVHVSDRERVREVAGVVVRMLNGMMKEVADGGTSSK